VTKLFVSYSTEEALVVKNHISLVGSTVHHCKNPQIIEKYPYSFVIRSLENSYYFGTSSVKERDEWAECLEQYCFSRARMSTITQKGACQSPPERTIETMETMLGERPRSKRVATVNSDDY
jgi:hypothetical protein